MNWLTDKESNYYIVVGKSEEVERILGPLHSVILMDSNIQGTYYLSSFYSFHRCLKDYIFFNEWTWDIYCSAWAIIF